jgi:N-acylglucosamine-6-phosphate 2-epimerase
MSMEQIVASIRGGLIVSCQALEDEPLHGADIMARMALAAQQGGAVGIRANSPPDIRAIRAAVPLPLIGIYKDGDAGVYITPTFWHAQAVAEAGADMIALDATGRPRPDGSLLLDIIRRIHAELGKPVLADISTLEEAEAAQAAGADMVATTLAGYTPYSARQDGPNFDLITALAGRMQVPVIGEGRISTPEDALRALRCGALAVVVGGAITRPQTITARFVSHLRQFSGE